jgi:flagellar biosynthesis protein FliP
MDSLVRQYRLIGWALMLAIFCCAASASGQEISPDAPFNRPSLPTAPTIPSAPTSVITSPTLTSSPLSAPLSLPDLTKPQNFSSAMQIIILLTVLSLAPAILLMMTSFTRIIIVLSLLRQALGTQQLRPIRC